MRRRVPRHDGPRRLLQLRGRGRRRWERRDVDRRFNRRGTEPAAAAAPGAQMASPGRAALPARAALPGQAAPGLGRHGRRAMRTGAGGRRVGSGGIRGSGGIAGRAASRGPAAAAGRQHRPGGARAPHGASGGATGGGGASGGAGGAASTCPPATPLTGGTKYCSNSKGNAGGGYAYELWSNGTGSGCMTVYGVDAKFSASWTNAGDFLARIGLQFDQTKTPAQIGTISSDFAETKTGQQRPGLRGDLRMDGQPVARVLHHRRLGELEAGRRCIRRHSAYQGRDDHRRRRQLRRLEAHPDEQARHHRRQPDVRSVFQRPADAPASAGTSPSPSTFPSGAIWACSWGSWKRPSCCWRPRTAPGPSISRRRPSSVK